MAKSEAPPVELPGAFSLFRPSVDALLRNIGTFVILFGIVFGLAALDSTNGSSAGPFELVSFIVQVILGPAIVYALLRSAADKTIAFDQAVKKGWPFVLRYFGLQIITVLFVLGGLILLVIPGLFALQRLFLAPYYLIDRNVGVFEAMRLSAADSKKHSMAVWGIVGVTFAIVLLMITIILIPVSIALLVAYAAAPAVRYLQIKQARKTR